MYDELLKNLQTITYDWCYLMIDEYMSKNEKRILDMVRKRMKDGEGVDGGVIGYYRSKWYRKFKEVLNPLARGTVDLFLTGALQRELAIQHVHKGYYYILSTDSKYRDLASKYGAEQFGLTEEQKEQIINEALSYLVDKIKEKYE